MTIKARAKGSTAPDEKRGESPGNLGAAVRLGAAQPQNGLICVHHHGHLSAQAPKRPWAWGQLACPKLDATNRLSAFGESLSRPCAQSKLHPAPLPQQLASNKRRWEAPSSQRLPTTDPWEAWRTR